MNASIIDILDNVTALTNELFDDAASRDETLDRLDREVFAAESFADSEVR